MLGGKPDEANKKLEGEKQKNSGPQDQANPFANNPHNNRRYNGGGKGGGIILKITHRR